MTYFVYTATNTVNGKLYHGKTECLQRRRRDHERDAKIGSDLPFHRAIRKYGKESFDWTVVGEFALESEANAMEIRLIADLPAHGGYNVAAGGDGGRTLTQAQVDAQYTLGPDRYDEFRAVVASSDSVTEVSRRMDVAGTAVYRTARRLGLSLPTGRRGAKPGDARPALRLIKPHQEDRFLSMVEQGFDSLMIASAFGVHPSVVRDQARRMKVKLPTCPRWTDETPGLKGKYTADERRERRRAATRTLSNETRSAILKRHVEDHAPGRQIAEEFGTTFKQVRRIVSAYYATLSSEDLAKFKHEHMVACRSGERNPSFGKKRPGVGGRKKKEPEFTVS